MEWWSNALGILKFFLSFSQKPFYYFFILTLKHLHTDKAIKNALQTNCTKKISTLDENGTVCWNKVDQINAYFITRRSRHEQTFNLISPMYILQVHHSNNFPHFMSKPYVTIIENMTPSPSMTKKKSRWVHSKKVLSWNAY